MGTQDQKSGKAVTTSTKVQSMMSDAMKQIKRNKKVISTLVEMKSKSPAIAAAITAVKEENQKLKNVVTSLMLQIIDSE